MQTKLVQDFENVTLKNKGTSNSPSGDGQFTKEKLQLKKLIPQLIDQDL